MKKEVVLSLILVILILGSIIGMSIGARPDNNDYIDENIYDDLNYESYLSQINATVKDTYPEIIVISITDFFDDVVIEEDLLDINGITKANIEFNKLQDDSIIVIIRLNVNNNEINNIINEINSFEYLLSEPIEYYRRGVIDINDVVVFQSLEDENNTIEYDFVDYRVEAIIGIFTEKEDVVEGQLEAVFLGENPEYLFFYETTNISSNPELIYGEAVLNVLNWEEIYLYVLEGNINELKLKEDLENLFEIENTVNTIKGNHYIYNNINDIDLDLNSVNIDEITDIINIDSNTVVFLKEDYSFEEYLKVINDLEDYNLYKTEILEEPTITYQIISEGLIEDIENKISSQNLSLIEISKKGTLDVSEIILNDVEYNYSEETYDYWFIYPEEIDQNSFNFSVQAYITKKDIMFLMLDKK